MKWGRVGVQSRGNLVRGDQQMIAKLQLLVNGEPKVLGGALKNVGEELATFGKRITPVDTGNLRASLHVSDPEYMAGRVRIRFGAGGPAGIGNVGGQTNNEAVTYAELVHEDPDMYHDGEEETYKFLEIPFVYVQKNFTKMLYKHVRLLRLAEYRGKL